MITNGEVVKLYLPNHINLLKTKHRYVIYKNINGTKQMASCTSDPIRALMVCGDGSYLTAICNKSNVLSPFEQTTFILLNTKYIAENVLIDRCLLTTPPKLYPELEVEFMKRFKLIKNISIVQRDSFIYINKPNVRPI